MNIKQSIVLAGLTVGAVLSSIAPAFAGTLTPSQLGLPTLGTPNAGAGDPDITGINSGTLSQFPYRTQTFSFSRDTLVRFNVLEPTGLGSRGRSLSNFGVLENGVFKTIFAEKSAFDNGSNNNNDWLGTCGKAISLPCVSSVVFRAGKTYQLALNPANKFASFGVGQVDSFTFNRRSDQLMSNPSQVVTLAKLGALFIGMEDGLFKNSSTPQTDDFYYDYQDWVVTADVPEPAMLIGLGAVASGMVLARRRKAAI